MFGNQLLQGYTTTNKLKYCSQEGIENKQKNSNGFHLEGLPDPIREKVGKYSLAK
jgi:hypothetical protein